MRARLLSIAQALAYVALGIALCGVVFEIAGYSAPLMFRSMVEGAFLSPGALAGSARWALPLFISACGVVVAFRAGFFNVGVQSQFYMGAIGAAATASVLDGMSPVIVVPAAVLAGMLGGALWALWPGLLRVLWNADEVLTTLMGNFIGTLFLIYVTSGPLKDPTGTGELSASKPIASVYRLSTSSGVSVTIFAIAAVVALLVWILLSRTAFGIVVRIAGRNPTMLAWQGGSVGRIGLVAFLISGALAGLAGAVEFLGPSGRLVSGLMPSHGFTAILVTLVGGISIPGAAVAALFFGGLTSAGFYLPIMAGLPSAATDVINAAIAFFVTGRAWPRFLSVGSRPAGGAGR